MALASQQRKGIRPRGAPMEADMVQAVCAVQDSSIIDEFLGNLLAYLGASDRKDVEAEARHLERCLELAHLPTVMSRDLIASESSYFCAWTRSDSRLAEAWLSQLKNRKPITPLIGIRIQIALACARGNFDDALSLWQKGIVFIGQLPSTLIKETIEESWREWGNEIREKSGQLVTQ